MSLKNTLFEASAGTGKTYQVTSLYQAMLLGRPYPGDGEERVFDGDPVDSRHILMLTFARNAAAEMRTRIVEGIERELTEAPPEEQPKYWRTLRALSGAAISTIHAYARRLLVEHALLAGVSPSVALMEESSALELFEEVTGAHLLDALDGPDQAVKSALEMLCLTRRLQGQRNAPGVIEVTMNLVAQARAWGLSLDEMTDAELETLAATPTAPHVDELVRLRKTLLGVFPNDDERPKGVRRLLTGLDDAIGALPDEAEGEPVATWAEGLVAPTKVTWGGGEEVKAARKDAAARLKQIAAYTRHAQAHEHLAPFLRFAATCHRLFQERKRELGMLDNDDLVLGALNLLRRNPGVHPGFKVIIVDEAQDNSRVQNELVECLAERCGASVILCGDWKQAIYTWRGADPGGLGRLADRIEETSGLLRKPLTTSFRSQKDLVRWINDAVSRDWVFGDRYGTGDRLRPRDIAEVTEGPSVELLLPAWEGEENPFEKVQVPPKASRRRDDPESKYRFELTKEDLARLAEAGDEGDDWEGLLDLYQRRASMEARAVARRIKLLCSDASAADWKPEWMWDGEAGRWREAGDGHGYRYRDVLILLRATSYQDLYETALREVGIRYTTDGKGRGFFFRQEVRDIVSLVTWLAWPTDDMSLVAVIRSPFIGLSDPAVALLSVGHAGRSEACASSAGGTAECPDDARPVPTRPRLRGTNLRSAMLEGGARTEDQAERLRDAGLAQDAVLYTEGSELLLRLRDLAGRLPAVELVREAIRLTGYDAALAGGFHGVQKLANMRKLLSLLQDTERRENLDLQTLAAWLSGQVNATQAPDAVVFDPEDDAVRISTVHAAKGLTSPVVVMPDLRRKSRPNTDWVLVRGSADRPRGIAAKLRSLGADGTTSDMPTSDFDEAREDAKQREGHELHRLFYVATTRPRDLLILSGESTTDDSSWRTWVNRHLDAVLDAEGRDAVEALVSLRGYGEIESACRALGGATEDRPMPLVEELARADTVFHPQRITRYRLPVTTLTGFPDVPADDDEDGRRAFENALRAYASSSLVGLEPARMVAHGEDRPAAEAAPDAAIRGTAGHELLEHFDFSSSDDLEARVLSALDADRRASPDLAPGLVAVVKHLSPLLRDATHVIRELPVTARFEHDGASCVVDGKVDLLFCLEGAWHIVDYKFANASAQDLVDRYGLQLQVYRAALSRPGRDGRRRMLLAEAGSGPVEVRMTLLGISGDGRITTANVPGIEDAALASRAVTVARWHSSLCRGERL